MNRKPAIAFDACYKLVENSILSITENVVGFVKVPFPLLFVKLCIPLITYYLRLEFSEKISNQLAYNVPAPDEVAA